MKEFDFDNPVKNLPDVYKKTTNSNNYKILEIDKTSRSTLQDDLSDIENILDMNEASGKTLDLYGERFGQIRGNTTDAQYLIMIKAKMARSVSNGSFPSVVKSICEAFGCNADEIEVVEGSVSGTIQTITIPIPIVNHAGLSSRQTWQIIKSLLPIGVTLDEYLLEGTFCFADDEDDYDESAGFADTNGTIGGTLGITESDSTDNILPI